MGMYISASHIPHGSIFHWHRSHKSSLQTTHNAHRSHPSHDTVRFEVGLALSLLHLGEIAFVPTTSILGIEATRYANSSYYAANLTIYTADFFAENADQTCQGALCVRVHRKESYPSGREI